MPGSLGAQTGAQTGAQAATSARRWGVAAGVLAAVASTTAGVAASLDLLAISHRPRTPRRGMNLWELIRSVFYMYLFWIELLVVVVALGAVVVCVLAVRDAVRQQRGAYAMALATLLALASVLMFSAAMAKLSVPVLLGALVGAGAAAANLRTYRLRRRGAAARTDATG